MSKKNRDIFTPSEMKILFQIRVVHCVSDQ